MFITLKCNGAFFSKVFQVYNRLTALLTMTGSENDTT